MRGHHKQIFILLLLQTVLMVGCEEKIRPSILDNIKGSSLPQQESWKSTIVITDSGRTNAIILSGYIRVFEESKETLLSEGVEVKFFNEEGEHTTTLTSEEAKVDDRTNNLEAIGNIVVVSDDSTKLETSRLFWNNGTKTIHTPDYVKITSPKERIQGYGMEADQRLRNYKIFRVTGEAHTK